MLEKGPKLDLLPTDATVGSDNKSASDLVPVIGSTLRDRTLLPGSGTIHNGLSERGDEEAAQLSKNFEGFVEFYGRHDAAESLIVGGWASRYWTSLRKNMVTAVFERGHVSAPVNIAFYERDDLGDLGIGFLLVLPASRRRLGKIVRLKTDSESNHNEIVPTSTVLELSNRETTERAEALLQLCNITQNNDDIRELLARGFVGEGYVDSANFHSASAGWFFSGWISSDWISLVQGEIEGVAHFESNGASGPVTLNCYAREDVHGRGVGVVFYLAKAENKKGRLLSFTLRTGNAVVNMRPAKSLEMKDGDSSLGDFFTLVANSDHGPARDQLLALTSRPTYRGHDTIAELPDQIFVEFDETIVCGTDSIVLIGWLLARPGTIKAMRVGIGDCEYAISISKGSIWYNRGDVIGSVGREHGFDDPMCGFLLRIPTGKEVDGGMHVEIETESGDLGFKKVTPSRREGLSAIKRLLECAQLEFADVDSVFDNVLGPAIGSLNALRMKEPLPVLPLQFGEPVQNPRHSVVITLYGRVDFMELQIALFAVLDLGNDVEIIYVLDDPRLTREAQLLANSLYQRFRLSFRLLCLGKNVGFAPANNVGLRESSGRYICFMNSDVFPKTGDWLDRLAGRLEEDPILGIVGPLLLFEDDSIQHQGIYFKELVQFGNWKFAQHKRKGFRPPAGGEITQELAVTGACMLIRRDTVLSCGGFDEAYVVGDFEDTDLCLKLKEKGYISAVDRDVQMHHLERKSQASSSALWRTNLTVYNAWIHQRRWGAKIAGEAEQTKTFRL